MSDKIFLNARYAFRSDTLENWQNINPVLEKGEPAIVNDGIDGEWLKIGDGVTPFNSLEWKKGPKGEQGLQGIKGDKGEKGDVGASGPQGVKGDKGDNYILTLEDKQEIANMVDVDTVTVDPTYSPTSENAQSGKAVAEAISGKADKDKWEIIHTTTLTQDGVVTITNDTNGKPFELKKIYIRYTTPAIDGDSASTGIWLHTRFTTNAYEYKPFLQGVGFARNKTKHGSFEAEIKAYWYGESRCTGDGAYGKASTFDCPNGVRSEATNSTHITGIRLCENYSGAMPSGAFIEIWGVKA